MVDDLLIVTDILTVGQKEKPTPRKPAEISTPTVENLQKNAKSETLEKHHTQQTERSSLYKVHGESGVVESDQEDSPSMN